MTKVFPIDLTTLKNTENNIRYKREHSDESLEHEKSSHEETNKRRKDTFVALISGKHVETSLSKGILLTILVVLIGLPSTFLYTLVPVHDLLTYPEFWYEILFHGSIVFTVRSIAFCLPASWFMNITQMRKIRTLASVCIASNFINTVLLITTYYVWTHILHYQPPHSTTNQCLFTSIQYHSLDKHCMEPRRLFIL